MRYKIKIAYDGTDFCGWQVQPNGQSIQKLIQNAIEIFLRHSIRLTGAGRTDAGVHAKGQVAHFDTEENLDSRKFLLSINALLPPSIRILNIEKVESSFHSRYSARSKVYDYYLHRGPLDPFVRSYRWNILGQFDVNLLKKAIPWLLGTHDFTSFTNQAHKGIAAKNPIRTLIRIDVKEEENTVRLQFEADGFLYKMVRNMTGTLVRVGRGKIPFDCIGQLIKERDRKKVPEAAPPQGLFLREVCY